MRLRASISIATASLLSLFLTASLCAQTVTFRPYIEPGDNGAFGAKDQMVVTWQTDESHPLPSAYTVQFGESPARLESATVDARVVDNYLSADPQFSALVLPFRYGAHSNYTAVLRNLQYDRTYFYTVSGPGLPAGGFTSSFHTRTRRGHFVFQVQGDEGYYPNIPGTNPPLTANYEARIINTMFNVAGVSFPGQPAFRRPDFALNTGDNVYVTGADSNYRDVWMFDWNANSSSNDHGAPFIRSIPLYIVAGNHDVGSSGATANLLADSGATVPGSSGPGPFGGGVGGGDALAYFNNYYFPLNGPEGADIQNHFTGDVSAPTNFFFQFNGMNYISPTAIEALRASTAVDAGGGLKRQIDHMSNYSFDYGNAHFVFLDANPHVFDNRLPGGPPSTAPAFPFPPYPSVLRDWLINDLDASDQTWKVVVFHQPIFSSGNATISNDQMRTIGQFLQDHGVNIVFNGHEHNYQRSKPIRARSNVTSAPVPGTVQVDVDNAFDGTTQMVPDGVLYFVEGAGGNRDFDDNIPNPRGGGASIDQDDAALGTTSGTVGGVTYAFKNGASSWLDTSMTDDAMKAFLPGAGTGTPITVRFKSKLFSFAHIAVDDNQLTLYQISEPLSATSSATASNPAPFGRDYRGMPVNDPLPNTVFDPVSRTVVAGAGDGVPALLDKLDVVKPDISDHSAVALSASRSAAPGDAIDFTFTFRNGSAYNLNGAQAIVTLPEDVIFDAVSQGTVTQLGSELVISLGRLLTGSTTTLHVLGHVSSRAHHKLHASASLRSGTALPVVGAESTTKVHGHGDEDSHGDED
jgi:hypothetical protein